MLLFFFFFKQKNAYEMRISDWSSDVCSSDLVRVLIQATSRHQDGRGNPAVLFSARPRNPYTGPMDQDIAATATTSKLPTVDARIFPRGGLDVLSRDEVEIGRASCRERVCQYV